MMRAEQLAITDDDEVFYHKRFKSDSAIPQLAHRWQHQVKEGFGSI